MDGLAYNMELSNVDLKSSLLSPGHQESFQQHHKLVRSYEEILESELNRANPNLKGHTNAVTGIALTSDNSFLISCGKDNTLRVWSLIDRVQEQKHDIKVEPGEEITLMTLSHDNKFVVLVISEKYLLIHSLDNLFLPVKVPAKENVTIKSVSVSNDNLQFCTADSEQTLKVYDLRGNVLKTHKIEENQLTFALFANKVVLFGDTSGDITAWNLLTSSCDYQLKHNINHPTAGLLYNNNHHLAVGYSSGEVVVWDLLEKSKEFHIDTEHNSIITGISYSSNTDNKTLVICNQQRELIFIDLIAKNIKRCFVRHSDFITGLLQTQDGRLVITSSHDKLIKIWQNGEFREYKASPKFGKDIKCTALHKSSDLLAIAYDNTSVKVFNLAEDREKLSLAWKGQSVYAAIWSHDKKQMITANSTPEISVFSYEGKSVEFTIPCDSTMNCLVLSPDSKLLYGCSGGSKIIAWNFHEKTVNHEFESENSSSHYVIAFSHDWTRMFSGGDSVVNIWDLESKTITIKLEGNTSSVRCLVPLSNGKTLISGGNDGKVIFWNLEENKLDVSIEEESAWARAMDLFNEEKFLVVVHDTSKITVVNIEEKKIEYDFSVSSQYSCKVLNDTTLIMGDSEYIRYYNLPEKKEEAVIKAHSNSIYSLLIDKENDTLISFSSDRTIKSWKISDKSQSGSYQSYCGTIRTLSLTSDYLGIGTEEGVVLIYPTSSTNEIKSLPVHTSTIQSLDYSSGNYATGSNDRRVGLFDMNEYKIHYFEGHTDWVRCVRFSHDGKLIFSASDDKKVKAWNIEKKTLDYELEGHEGYVYSLCVFPNGKYLASGSADKQVKLWNLALRKEESSFENHSGNVNALCLTDNESILFSGSDDNLIAAIDLNTKKLICLMTGHSSSISQLNLHNNVLFSTTSQEIKNWLINEKKEIFSFRWRTDSPMHLALSPDENYLASSFNEGAVRIYDFKHSKFLDTFQPFGSNVPRIAFTQDSKSLLLACAGFNIVVWDIEHKSGQEIPGTKTTGRNVVFSHDFSLLATYSDDSKALVWNWAEKKVLFTLEGHESDSQVMTFSHDNKFLFVGTDGGAVFKWNLETKENHQFKEHGNTVRGLAFSPSRNLLVSGSHDRKVCFYDLEKNEVIKSEEKHSDWVRTMAITKDDKYVISAGDDKVLVIWDLETKDVSFKLEGHSNYIFGIAISSDNNNVYTGAQDKSILSWSLTQKKKLRHLRAVCGSIYCITLTKDGTRAYTGSDECTVNIFDLSSKTEVACLSGHSRIVCDLALSEDETLLVSGSWDYSVRVYNTRTFEDVAVFKDVHTDYVRSVAITRNNKYVISGSDDRCIIFWNLEKKEKEFTLEGHRNYIYSVRLIFDEKYLISASRDETLKLWDIENKTEVYTFTGHTAAVRCLAIFNSNKGFVSGSEDNLIKAWSIQHRREDYTLKGHTGTVTTIKITSDDLRLISGSEDYKINVWDLEQRTIELSLTGYTSSILAINITDQGSLMLTAGNDKTLKLWKMSEPSLAKDQTMSQKPFINVHTPDGKYQLTYLYGRLSEVVKKDSISNKLEMGITDVYDPYYQNLLKFYNLIDNIRGGQFDTLLISSGDAVFSKFLYTTLHILANSGNSKILDTLFSGELQIKTDYFGKSPLYYALVKQHQECTDKILNFLIYISESKDKSKILNSFSAISNDLPLIIRNSSKGLQVLLKSCLIPTDPAFAKISEDLPIYRFNSNFLPIANDFVTGSTVGVETIPVIMKYTPFTLPCKMGSEECIDFLESIIECSNTSIYNTHLIQYIIQIQWDQLIYWVFGYTFLLWLNLVFLVLLFTIEHIGSSWELPVYLIINFLLIFWESIQMYMGGFIEYFKDAWNVIDFFRFWLSMGWVVMNVADLNSYEVYKIVAWLVALLNFTRGLTGFRLFDGTRYYVRLILRALGDMGYFFIILGYSTITFGVMFQVSRTGEPFEFKTLWMDSYSLNFGNFEAQDGYKFSFETIAYMLATVVNVILMLNLLISILGDSYSNFQTDKVFIDYSEKASVILEIQKMFFWVGKTTERKYFHVMCASTAADEEVTMDEKIDDLMSNLENSRTETESQSKCVKDEISNQIQLFENKFQDKISVVEGKIGGLETKFTDFSETLNKILEHVKPKPEEKKEEAKSE